MPLRGYKQSESHKNKISLKAKMRPNGWFGRKHTASSLAKMRGPKSAAHRYKMSQSAIRRWNKPIIDEKVWVVNKVDKREDIPVSPVYRDIFMDDRFIDSEGNIWEEV